MHLPSLIFVLPSFQQDGKGSISKQAEVTVCTLKKYTYEHIHFDSHVNLLNLQIDPIGQNVNGHRSLHGVSIRIKTSFTYYTIYHISAIYKSSEVSSFVGITVSVLQRASSKKVFWKYAEGIQENIHDEVCFGISVFL